MNKFLRSFVAGIGSVLSIYPQPRISKTAALEAIGGDFSKVGGDIATGIRSKAEAIYPSNPPQNGNPRAEQLHFTYG
jgi:hypothetical protein